MFLGNERGSPYFFLLLGLLLLFLLVFSFRDTLRASSEFFDPAVIRKFLRTCVPKFSLRSLLIAAAILPPCLAYLAKPFFAVYESGLWFFILALGYLVLMLGILLYYSFSDSFGAGPRKRWEKYLKKTKPRR